MGDPLSREPRPQQLQGQQQELEHHWQYWKQKMGQRDVGKNPGSHCVVTRPCSLQAGELLVGGYPYAPHTEGGVFGFALMDQSVQLEVEVEVAGAHCQGEIRN